MRGLCSAETLNFGFSPASAGRRTAPRSQHQDGEGGARWSAVQRVAACSVRADAGDEGRADWPAPTSGRRCTSTSKPSRWTPRCPASRRKGSPRAAGSTTSSSTTSAVGARRRAPPRRRSPGWFSEKIGDLIRGQLHGRPRLRAAVRSLCAAAAPAAPSPSKEIREEMAVLQVGKELYARGEFPPSGDDGAGQRLRRVVSAGPPHAAPCAGVGLARRARAA